MTRPPEYITHEVNEKDVAVDWFFGHEMRWHKVSQLAQMIIGWFFALLPVIITVSALAYRNDPDLGWWNYSEGFHMWEVTMLILGLLMVVFIVGFLSLHLIHRMLTRTSTRRITYDAERLARRLELAEDMYGSKYGDEALRVQRKKVTIEPYQDIETYELRDLYRDYGVD